MVFFAVVMALLLEQARPLGAHNLVFTAMRHWALWCGWQFDTGRPAQSWLAWAAAVGVPTVVAWGVHALLAWGVGWPVAMLWDVLVLYFTLGFRQFSHHFTGLRDALEAGDEELARERLAAWLLVDAADLPRREIVRHTLETSVLAAHHHVFGVLACYSLLAAIGLGPAGAVLYRMAEFVARYWRHKHLERAQLLSPALDSFARRAWYVIDWLPARMTAFGFAVMGSFEDAIDGWRQQAQRAGEHEAGEADNDAIILAATAGALGVRLGGQPLKPALEAGFGVPAGPIPGRDPEVAHLRSVVGLVWRTVLAWLVLLALLTLARLLG